MRLFGHLETSYCLMSYIIINTCCRYKWVFFTANIGCVFAQNEGRPALDGPNDAKWTGNMTNQLCAKFCVAKVNVLISLLLLMLMWINFSFFFH